MIIMIIVVIWHKKVGYMQDKILKKMLSYEADLQDIKNYLRILNNYIENDNQADYLEQFIKIIERKVDSFSQNYEELNNQIWVLIN